MASLLRANNTQALVTPKDGMTFTEEELYEFIEGERMIFHDADDQDVILISNSRGNQLGLALNNQLKTDSRDIYGNALMCHVHELSEKFKPYTIELSVVKHEDGRGYELRYNRDHSGEIGIFDAIEDCAHRLVKLEKKWRNENGVRFVISKIVLANGGYAEFASVEFPSQ